MKPVIVFVLPFILLLSSSIIHASEWEPEFDAAQIRQPLDSFHIAIPQSVSLEVLRTLALELDHIDVTAMVTREGNDAVFTPLTPLELGQHELRLVEYADDGSIIERGYWLFDIRRQSGLSDAEYSADFYLATTTRIADKNLTAPKPTQSTTQGSASLYGKVASEAWTFTGNLDLLYNGQEDPLSNRDELDLGEYLLTGESTNTQFNVGHHSLAQTSLAMEGFHRRGVSVSRGIDDLNSALTGFVLRSEDINGFKHGLGIGDSSNAVIGVIFENQPISNAPESLYLSTTYLTGESHRVGIAVGAKPITLKGSAWAVVADSTVWDQQLRLRAEMASSTTDVITQDTTDIDLINAKGKAYAFLISYSHQLSSTVVFNTGVELSLVDSLYHSIANPNLPNDKELKRLFFNADWQGLGMQLSTAQELDNVDNNATRPQIETKHSQIRFSYGLTQMPAKGSVFDVLGLPSFSLQWDATLQDEIKASNVSQTANSLAINSHSYRLGADFNKTDWSWGASMTDSEQKDKIVVTRQSDTQSTEVHSSFQVSPRILVSPSWSTTKTLFSDNNERLDSETITLISQLNLTDSLNGQLLWSDSKSISESTIGLQDNDVSTLSVQFRWQWIKAKTNSPGFDISVSGTQQDIQDNLVSQNSIAVNQVFLTLEMSLPLASER